MQVMILQIEIGQFLLNNHHVQAHAFAVEFAINGLPSQNCTKIDF